VGRESANDISGFYINCNIEFIYMSNETWTRASEGLPNVGDLIVTKHRDNDYPATEEIFYYSGGIVYLYEYKSTKVLYICPQDEGTPVSLVGDVEWKKVEK